MDDVQERIRRWWDDDAAVYDSSASHSVSDPVEAAAWRAALGRHLPPGARVLDVGAGTGSISLLAAELGFHVTALDLSAEMLGRARAKADERGLDVEFVEGAADQPPPGPFDAVMERHLLWTTLDPERVLRAWREVTVPGCVLVLFEGLWGKTGAVRKARSALAERVRQAKGVRHDHHAEYDQEVLATLPLARQQSLRPLVETVTAAGWSAVRLERLRDVEWARREAAGPVLGPLETIPQFAITARA